MNVLITGTSRGLGAALVKYYLGRGDRVWGVGRSAVDTGEDEGYTYSACDVKKRDDVRRVIAEMGEADFVPDLVILNAGAATDDAGADSDAGLDLEKFTDNFQMNLFGSIYWVEELLPGFLKRGSGRFAAVSSLSVLIENHAGRVGYSASKAALAKTFENLRTEYFGSGVGFTVFYAGRMTEEGSLLGTTYDGAARLVARTMGCGESGDCGDSAAPPASVSFPTIQYLLTRVLTFVPTRVFRKYVFK